MLSIKFDTKILERFATDLEKRVIPYATRAAINSTGKAIKDAERREMSRVFDRPTPRTLNATFLKPATKADMTAKVWIKDEGMTPPVRWLFPQIVGGRRGWKRFEKALQYVGAMPQGWFAVPGQGMPLDNFGNIPSGRLRQILSQLRAQMVGGYESRTGGATNARGARRRTIMRQGYRVFSVPQGRGRLPPGVYASDLFGRNLQPLIMFVRNATYRPRFHFFQVGQRVVDTMLEREFVRYFDELKVKFAGSRRG